MTKKIAICIALAGLFIGLAVGINVGGNFELPTIVNVVFLATGGLFGVLAANFHQKSTTK